MIIFTTQFTNIEKETDYKLLDNKTLIHVHCILLSYLISEHIICKL